MSVDVRTDTRGMPQSLQITASSHQCLTCRAIVRGGFAGIDAHVETHATETEEN